MVISFHACRLCLLFKSFTLRQPSLRFSMLTCYHDNMITHKTDFVNPHSYIGEISAFVTKSFWASINYLILANYSKVQFYKNSTNSLTLSPNPFPRKGAILLGLPPLVPVGGYAPQPHFIVDHINYLMSQAP